MNSKDRHELRYQRRKQKREDQKQNICKQYGIYDKVFTFEHLYKSYRLSVKGVGWKGSVQRYKLNALSRIKKTSRLLKNEQFRSKGFYEFDIIERGKPRHIRSVHINERVVQRCLCDYSLVPVLSRSFVYDNGASIKNKGYDFSIHRITKHLRQFYKQHGNNGYILMFDFSKYFDNIDHQVIFNRFNNSGLDSKIIELSKHFVECFGDIGLGLGSQISQIAAISVPNKIDHYMKDAMRLKYYGRYMDDGYVISNSKEELNEVYKKLVELCNELHIKLNTKKTQIIKLTRGFNFLKVSFSYGRTGKIIKKPLYRTIVKMKKKLKVFKRWLLINKLTEEDIYTSFQSWYGHKKRFQCWHALNKTVILYNQLFNEGEKHGKCPIYCTHEI